MAKFKNISTGPRGLYTTDGLVMVEAGATSDDVVLATSKDLDGKDVADEPNEEWFAKAGSVAAKQADAGPLDHDDDGRKGGTKPAAK